MRQIAGPVPGPARGFLIAFAASAGVALSGLIGCAFLSPGVPGGGGDTITITATDGDLDGWTDHDGDSPGCDIGTEIQVGGTHVSCDDAVIAFESFDLPMLGNGVTIASAKLQLFLTDEFGDPFGEFLPGGARVDHINYGPTFDGDVDFYMPLNLTGSLEGGATVYEADIGPIATNATPGWKELDVTDQVQADLDAQRPRSQFGFRFLWDKSIADPNGDDCTCGGDYILFEDAGNTQGTGNRPRLVITLQK